MPRNMLARLEYMLTYEPSWFAEFLSAGGLFGWAVMALTTDRFSVEGWALAMPLFLLAFGPVRMLLLFGLSPLPRVVGAMVGFVFYAQILTSAWRFYGHLPVLGIVAMMALGDPLTAGKFSFDAIRSARKEA